MISLRRQPDSCEPRPVRVLRLLVFCIAILATPLESVSAEGLGSIAKSDLALKGQIYFLQPGTARLPNLETMQRQGTVYVSELNVTPRSFRAGFPGVTERFEWFAVDYSGTFKVSRSGIYRFRLTSDDGAVLRIDGQMVIDNDGIHGPSSKEGSIELRAGVHDIHVQYFQGPATEIALVLEAAFSDKAYEIFPAGEMSFVMKNWWEVVMDTTTVIATFALLSFMVERLTNGITLLLGYTTWWQERMEVPRIEDLPARSGNERNRRVALFGIGVILAVPGTLVMGIDILSQLQLPQMPELAGEAITGLLIASGADPIREFARSRELRVREGAAAPQPIQVAGTLVVQQSPAPQGDVAHSE